MSSSFSDPFLTDSLASLSPTGISPKAVILIAPFTSLPELLTTYRLAGIPLISPLALLPSFYGKLSDEPHLLAIQDTWMSRDHLIKTKAPVLIIHAKDDHDIPASHSKRLFEMLSKSRSPKDGAVRTKIVKRDGWGTVALHISDDPTLDHIDSLVHGGVAWFEADHGAHNRVGGGEGVIEMMRAFVQSDKRKDLECSILGDEI
ncbi:hypothetical protein QFC19_008081 [Naganishia cerealis]|uniref:Uncharacterized protein n=1 Tax=Naganishia cerealis TaxID=610337 RepID=A0ACC2V4L3_9TREE|nr:hypothetical protein QFC19_008081 [Naganishia cerealis]